ncbi:restriction endonuclease subunit S [Mycoplasmopsis bovis]|uniref:restriction endonuclease subunit S n=1 Tax=Mycoplasmopsis bovis TaxID=28903 RepID=UPI001E34E398
MMIASDVKKYGKFDVYDPNKIVGKTDAEPFRSDYISIVKDGDAGRIRLLPKNTMILSTMGALIAKDPFKIDFLYYMLNAINDLSRERNGSIIPHIYFKDYGQNIYNLPSIPEQSKISSLFTYLDSLITLHQRKLSSLKNLKNRLLDRMFCDEKSQFPSIRFTEFTNAWEQKKLRNVVSYHSSMMIASDVKKYGKFDVYDPNKIVGKTDAEPFRSDYISIVKDGDAGRIRLLPKNTMILSTMGALIAKDPFKIDFLYYMLNAINDLSRERNGSIIPHIYFKDYGQNIYNLPSIPEQSKISSLFTYLDSLITLHQRKLLSLKNLKSRLLDRMFCDEKSQFPSIRFKEFTNVWEQEKLGECSKFYNGLTSVSKSDFGVGKDLYIDYLNVFNNTFSQFSELKKFKNSSRQNYVQFKDVILTISSETPDEVAMSSVINWKNDYKNVAFNSFCILVRFNQLEKYDVNYIGYFFRSNSFRTQAMLMAQGISRFNINQTALKKTLFLFPPNIYEQQKIGNVLYYLDSLITLHQRKRITRTV